MKTAQIQIRRSVNHFDSILRPKDNVDKIIDVKILCNRWSESGSL